MTSPAGDLGEQTPRRFPRARRLLTGAATALAATAAGAITMAAVLGTDPAGPFDGLPAATPTVDPDAVASPGGAASPSATPDPLDTGELARRYADDLGELADRSGVVVLPVGGGDAVTLGEEHTGVAWSTIKVPIVVAARTEHGWESTRRRAELAITISDNDATRDLWSALGGGARAATAVEDVLAAAGDTTTRVDTSGYFGRTDWAVPDQATAMAGLACLPEAAETIALMRRVDDAQRWGLGRVEGAAIKGGWDETEGGEYLVRQMALLPTGTGESAVAALVRAPGGFAAGTADLDRITDWLQDHLTDLPSSECP